MARWTFAEPKGQENKNRVSERIREGKSAMEAALQAGGHFPGPDTANPIYITKINYGITGDRPASSADFTGRWYVNSTNGTIERDNGSSYVKITEFKDVLPAGTKLLFIAAAAPTGWTQITTGVDDKTIRITNTSTIGSGGSHSISSPPTHTHTTEKTELTHSHALSIQTQTVTRVGGGELIMANVSSISNNTVSLNHNHDITAEQGFAPYYVDGIICEKDTW
jgi:hypothetical protein